jgi:hypothetical protein
MREFLSTWWSLIAIVALLATVRDPNRWKSEWEGYLFTGIALLCCVLLAIGWRDLGRNTYSRVLRWCFLPIMLPLLLVVGLSGVLIFPLIAGMVYFGIDLFILSPRRKLAANRPIPRKWR